MKCYHGQIASLFSIIMLVMSGYAADSGQMTLSEDKNILTTTLNIQTPVEKGVSFLLGRQQEDGSWGSDEKRKLVDSSESLQTLYRVQADENVLGKSLRFFSALTGDNHEILACKLLALANGTAAIDELAEELIAAQLADGGWGISESQTGSIPHTLLAVNALLASNKSSSAIGNGTSFLISSQHSDGSWIFSGAHSLSDTAHTAMALQLLKKVQNRNTFTGSGLDQAIAKAQEYLERQYNSGDGSYGDVVDTAWAYLALAGVKQPAQLQATLTYLNNAQMADGSWNNKVYDTAVCLRALTAIKAPVQGDLPDLEITARNISFVPGEPVAGDEVTILTTIYNNGYDIAEGVKVEFFNRDPRVDGVEIANSQTIPLIPDGGSAQVTATFSTKGMKGRVPIMVFVDRANAILESSKANNSATTYLNVDASEVNLPNLTITALSFSPEEPLPGEAVTALITVENNGKTSAPATKLRLTYGNPFSASASVIAEAEVPALDVNASKTISVEFNAADEIANLFAWVDSEEAVEEISEDDNVFNQALSEKELPDLIVDASSVSFSHTDLDNGAMVAIHFVVENIGKVDAAGFKADVTGKQNGQIQKIDSVAIPRLAAGEAIDCTVAWLATTGETEFSISADRNNEVQEITVMCGNKWFCFSVKNR